MLGLRSRMVLRCCVWINSRIRGSKQGVTNNIISHVSSLGDGLLPYKFSAIQYLILCRLCCHEDLQPERHINTMKFKLIRKFYSFDSVISGKISSACLAILNYVRISFLEWSEFNSLGPTLASWIIVYIRVFILRKFSDLYGLIWVYTLIWNSPFHPIRILFKSIRLLYGGKVNKDVKFPPKISFTKSNEGKSHPMIMWPTGPHFVENTHIYH